MCKYEDILKWAYFGPYSMWSFYKIKEGIAILIPRPMVKVEGLYGLKLDILRKLISLYSNRDLSLSPFDLKSNRFGQGSPV